MKINFKQYRVLKKMYKNHPEHTCLNPKNKEFIILLELDLIESEMDLSDENTSRNVLVFLTEPNGNSRITSKGIEAMFEYQNNLRSTIISIFALLISIASFFFSLYT